MKKYVVVGDRANKQELRDKIESIVTIASGIQFSNDLKEVSNAAEQIMYLAADVKYTTESEAKPCTTE